MSRVANVILFAVFAVILIHVYIQTILGRPIFFRNTSAIEKYTNAYDYDPEDLKAQLMSYVYGNRKQPLLDRNSLQRTRNFGVHEQGVYGNAHSANFYNEDTDLSKYFTTVPTNTPPAKSLQYGLRDNHGHDIHNGPNRDKPVHYDVAADGSLIYRRDQWRYHNENMMNGGPIDGYGLDGLTGVDPNFYGGPTNDYAVYANNHYHAKDY